MTTLLGYCRRGHLRTLQNTQHVSRRDRPNGYVQCLDCKREQRPVALDTVELVYAMTSRCTPRLPCDLRDLVAAERLDHTRGRSRPGYIALRTIHKALVILLDQGRIVRVGTNSQGRVSYSDEESGYLRARAPARPMLESRA